MRHEFLNQRPVPINPGKPKAIQSTIDVASLAESRVEDVEVVIDMTHTWTDNLTVSLRSPDGTDVVLVKREGDTRNDFRRTIFRADARNSITQGQGPFRGAFRPKGDLGSLYGEKAQGTWKLVVTKDRENQDGGSLNQWALGLVTNAVSPVPFQVEVRFLGGLSPNQQAAFAGAARRWSQIITGDIPPMLLEGEIIDDVLIEAQGKPIDGPGRILGQAGPLFLRPSSMLPIKGIMSFDTADLDRMEHDGTLEDVILHEMAHVLGFGTLWDRMGLIRGQGSINPTFLGASTMREYGLLRHQADTANTTNPTPVPVANTGGSGTRDAHWREVVFADELLTGFLSGKARPISRMSIGAFEDMGYQVNLGTADSYALPSMLKIAELGLFGTRHDADTCAVERVEPIVVPPAAMINTLG